MTVCNVKAFARSDKPFLAESFSSFIWFYGFKCSVWVCC